MGCSGDPIGAVSHSGIEAAKNNLPCSQGASEKCRARRHGQETQARMAKGQLKPTRQRLVVKPGGQRKELAGKSAKAGGGP
jgi:hypothetical protein